MKLLNVIHNRPPNFADIDAIFNVRTKHGVLFCYGSNLFNPSGVEVPTWIMAHEIAHSERQGDTIDAIRAWWGRYLTEPKFRLDEEIIAHQAEWKAYLETRPNRQQRRGYLVQISKRLSSDLYGKMITKERAKEIIQSHTQTESAVCPKSDLPASLPHQSRPPSNQEALA